MSVRSNGQSGDLQSLAPGFRLPRRFAPRNDGNMSLRAKRGNPHNDEYI